jgi:nucleoside-diphosphate-sugar epimerase
VKRILVTGGLGNLGSWITEYLVKSGYDVTTFSSRNRPVLHHLTFQRLFGDISNESRVKELFAQKPWDAIVHLASINEGNVPGYPREALQINTLGTRNLLQALAESGHNTHFIYFSTFHVYGAAAGNILEDATPASPKNDYAATHLFAEYYVKQFNFTHHIPHTIFRLTNSYGSPKEISGTKWYLILNDLARMAVQEKKIRLNSNGLPKRDFIWMGDVCEIVGKCIEKGPANTTFNIANGRSISMLEVATTVQKAYSDQFSMMVPVQKNEADKNTYDDVLTVSIDKLKQWIDFQSHDKMYDEAIAIFQLLKTPN